MRIGGGGSIVHFKFGIYLHVLDTYAYKCIYMDYIKFQYVVQNHLQNKVVLSYFVTASIILEID